MKIQVSEEIVCRDLSGEAVLLDLATGTYFGLNEMGTRVWQLIQEHGSTESVIAALVEEYDVEEARVRRDLDALIRQLDSRGLVRIHVAQATHPG